MGFTSNLFNQQPSKENALIDSRLRLSKGVFEVYFLHCSRTGPSCANGGRPPSLYKAAKLLKSAPNEINDHHVARSCPGGPGGSPPPSLSPPDGSTLRRRVPLGSKSHTPVTHQLTNQGREVSEVVATRRLVKFPARLIAQEIVRVQDARVSAPASRSRLFADGDILYSGSHV